MLEKSFAKTKEKTAYLPEKMLHAYPIVKNDGAFMC
jgi:hypothetical protein